MSEQLTNSLENLNIDAFLQSGAIIQNPENDQIILGVEQCDHNDYFIYQASFYNNETFIKYYKEYYLTDKASLLNKLEASGLKRSLIRCHKSFDNEFIYDVEKILNLLANNKNLQKMVACTYANYEYVEKNCNLLNFLKAPNEGFLYGYWEDEQGIIGLTPEPLFYKYQEHYKTFALAGSFPADLGQELINSEKNLEEHNLVILDIKEKLSELEAQIDVGDTSLFYYKNLVHLKTPIDFKLPGKRHHIVEKLSPTSALGGYPKMLSLSKLKELKYYDYQKSSRIFGGVVGFGSGDEKLFGLVGIRNIFFNKESMEIHSGAGIVKDSIVKQELAEIKLKRSSIESLFL